VAVKGGEEIRPGGAISPYSITPTLPGRKKHTNFKYK